MLEKVGDKDIVVQDYTSNFDVKEYIQEVLIPKAFPDIPMNKLNLGFTGITSEIISTAIEDAHATSSLMMNEAFITKAVLPNSIFSDASIYGLGYSFAVPSTANFGLQLSLSDVIENSVPVRNTTTMRYVLDKNTSIIMGNNSYRPDYDIIIDHQFVDGRRVFNVYYDMSEPNSISNITNKYIKHQVTSINWLILFLDLMEFDRKVEENAITDNLITTNSEIRLRWSRQIAGIDLMYVSPQGSKIPMKLKTLYTSPNVDPFVWYNFEDDNTIVLSFSGNTSYWTPEFNSKIISTIYTCNGKSADFNSYDRTSGIPVQKVSDRYSYNADTKMVALCYTGSNGGQDRGTIEDLRRDTILAHNTANVLSTDHDLKLWFNRFADKYNTRSKFFKRRDDPSGQLFSQFVAITDNNYVYPTNTLTLHVSQNNEKYDQDQCEFDYINRNSEGVAEEFIIKPGHLWEYADEDGNICRDKVRMVRDIDGKIKMITDEVIPSITEDRPFMFVNPFFIKIHRDPVVSMNYNYLINDVSWPEDIPINTECFYQFQLATFSIERSISPKYNNMYHLELICVPVVTNDNTIKYIEGIGDEFNVTKNNLRIVLITRTANDGETGYIEMIPKENRPGGAILFEANIAVHDNIRSDMQIEVDLSRTPGMRSLITSGSKQGQVFMDSSETSFHFAVMMKNFSSQGSETLYNDPTFTDYVMANRFANAHRDLTLYKPMSMMRSIIGFSGDDGNYSIDVSLMPLLRYDLPLDDDKMTYFIRTFANQYKAMEPIISKLEGNAYLDFKLFNTYGRSCNYYIGPMDGDDVLKNSTLLLNDIYVKIRWKLSVYDRSMYTQTANDIINEITKFFESLNENDTDVYVSDIIHTIVCNNPNVRYVRFLGFNDYDANKQAIFVKYTDISELREDQLSTHVPEIIRVDSNSIEIIEEV